MKHWRTYLTITVVAVLLFFTVWSLTGSGGFKRMVTLTGVYAVCRPNGYDAVCFLDADSKNGGLSCMPLNSAGGECRR